jgi:hypothetical protein
VSYKLDARYTSITERGTERPIRGSFIRVSFEELSDTNPSNLRVSFVLPKSFPMLKDHFAR